MQKIEGCENNAQEKGWLDKSDVWAYDEITRRFRDVGYSWKVCQRKADRIMRCEKEK